MKIQISNMTKNAAKVIFWLRMFIQQHFRMFALPASLQCLKLVKITNFRALLSEFHGRPFLLIAIVFFFRVPYLPIFWIENMKRSIVLCTNIMLFYFFIMKANDICFSALSQTKHFSFPRVKQAPYFFISMQAFFVSISFFQSRKHALVFFCMVVICKI